MFAPMQVFSASSRIIVTCNKRLSPYLQQEITELGYNIVKSFITGVELQGTLTDCMHLCMHLRCASQVLYSIKSFKASHPNDVYDALKDIAWEELIDKDGYFSVTSNVFHSSVNNNLFANVKVKDAIVDRIREQTGVRPNTGPELDSTVVHLFWNEEGAEIFIDAAGETLAKHGYRKIPGKAPMLEALAAATVMATRWDRQSPFINPMCGSGTVAIEAALIATQRYPGIFRRNYGFMHVTGYDEEVYDKALAALRNKIKQVPGLQIIATDLSEDAIFVSGVNATEAGVRDLLEFEMGDFAITKVPEDAGGVVFFNPEYGERLGDIDELTETYGRIGDFMKKKCKGYTGYVFTGNLELAKHIGLKPKRRLEFYTSKIDCRLYEYELYAGTKRTDKIVENL